MYKFWAFLNRMKNIKRWSLMHSVTEENIMEHSWQVVTVAHALALLGNKNFGKNYDLEKVILLAQYHETGEVITGDLPTPIKYFNPEIRTAYKDLENGACERLIKMLPDSLQEEYLPYVISDETTEEHKIVKYADRLSALIKCMDEIRAGNSEFKKAEKTIRTELEKSDYPEVQFFLKEILPSYKLTLDELD